MATIEKNRDAHRGEDYTQDGSVDLKGKPVLRSETGTWKACYFIIGYEILERMAFHGIQSNLVSYLTRKLLEGTVTSANNVTNWSGTVWITPILGAYIADAYLGRYWTFVSASATYLLVLVAAAKKARVPIPNDPKELYELSSEEYSNNRKLRIDRTPSLRFLDKAAVKSGPNKPWNLCPVTQVEETKQMIKMIPVLLATFIPSAYVAQATGAGPFLFLEKSHHYPFPVANAIANYGYEVFERMAFHGIQSNLVVYLTRKLHEGTVKSANNVTNWVGNVPVDFSSFSASFKATTMQSWGLTLSVIVFLVGTRFYRHKVPSGSPITGIAQVLLAAARKWKVPFPNDPKELHELSLEHYANKGKFRIDSTSSLRFLDKAAVKSGPNTPWTLCPVTQVEETKQMIKMIPILIATFIPIGKAKMDLAMETLPHKTSSQDDENSKTGLIR
ncbi:hypothetical protein FEM48_Zijuj09G0061900 [Ziziphus jujuba var. spinosa]|uniref:Protein NRT1/ PTR FAMILY 5.2-like n=1 Tax=Ziziphus jujuba var. spinosa TaxID=714518 RepID=A0A978URC3_ZIZJJ|nr:hypothetical protein FEM48_Zijuj09G0061900 [Ziziphus jujuba var. spinosa]